MATPGTVTPILFLDKYKAELLLEALEEYLSDADEDAPYIDPCNEMMTSLNDQISLR